MHAGIGAARAVDANLLAADCLHRVLKRALHGRSVVLDLPTGKRRAVIFDDEFVAGHQGTAIHCSSWPGLTRPSIFFARVL
jgi:hypothetical protein